jgi:hypothetical protein
MLAIKIF